MFDEISLDAFGCCCMTAADGTSSQDPGRDLVMESGPKTIVTT